MKRLALGLVLCLTSTLPFTRVLAQDRSSVDVSGAWVLTVEMSMGTATPTIDLTQDGEKISGIYVSRYGDYPVAGTVKGRRLTFSFTMRADDPVTITYTGEVSSDGRTIRGTANLGEMGEATWTARRGGQILN